MQNINVLCIDTRGKWNEICNWQKAFETCYHISLKPYSNWLEGKDIIAEFAEESDAVLLIVGNMEKFLNKNAKQFFDILSVCQLQHKEIFYLVDTDRSLQNAYFRDSRAYLLGKDEEYLAEAIRQKVDSTEERQIKAMYADTWNAIDACGIPRNFQKIIMDMFLCLHHPEDYGEISLSRNYNPMRTILQFLLGKYVTEGILPNAFRQQQNSVNLSDASFYLSGGKPDHVKLKYSGKRIFPLHIELIVRQLLGLGNRHSHPNESSETGCPELDSYKRGTESKSLLFSTLFGLCEFIEWSAKLFKMVERGECQVLDAVPLEDKTEEPKQEECELSTDIPPHDDTVYVLEHDENNNVHCGKYLLSYNKYKDYPAGTKGNVSSIKRNNKNNKDRYPLFAGKFDIVD